jgi:hypothetical protein
MIAYRSNPPSRGQPRTPVSRPQEPHIWSRVALARKRVGRPTYGPHRGAAHFSKRGPEVA